MKIKNGDLVKVLPTKHVLDWSMGKKAVGYEFKLDISYLDDILLKDFYNDDSRSICVDPTNKYKINYRISDLQLVNKIYEIYY